MMMTAAAGHGHVRRALYENNPKPIPRWVWAAVAVSALVHVAGGIWLYNQRYEMPAQATVPDEGPIIIMERPVEPEPPVIDTPEPPAPLIPVHATPVPTRPDVPASPFEAPDEPTTAPVGEGPISLDPGPVPDTPGTATDPTPPIPPVIRSPQWIRQPSAAQMQRAYPRGAVADGISGRVVLNCRLTAAGEVTGCSVASETPAGEGFDRAALSLSRYFRLSPRTVDGQAIEGARVTIPLNFAIE
ncbi:MAG: TonB family protein [Caulobacterales bacterium]|nr:TonB family protein [Caulobacterales bacterium]